MDMEDKSSFEPNAKKCKIDGDEEKCSICQESFGDQSLFLAPCKHKFHFTCAIKLLAESKDAIPNREATCPLCRHTLSAEQEATAAVLKLPASRVYLLTADSMIKAIPSDFNYSIPDHNSSSVTLTFRTGENNNWRVKNKDFGLIIHSDNFSNIQTAMGKVDRRINTLESNKLRAIADCQYCSRLLLGPTPGWKRCTYCGLTFCCRLCEEEYGHSCREGEMVALR